MDKQKVAKELLAIAKELTSAKTYKLGDVVAQLRKYNRLDGVKIAGSDDNLAIYINRVTDKGNNIVVSLTLVEDSGGNGSYFSLKGTEIVSRKSDGRLLEHNKVRSKIKSLDPDAYIPVMTDRQLKAFEKNYILDWINTSW